MFNSSLSTELSSDKTLKQSTNGFIIHCGKQYMKMDNVGALTHPHVPPLCVGKGWSFIAMLTHCHMQNIHWTRSAYDLDNWLGSACFHVDRLKHDCQFGSDQPVQTRIVRFGLFMNTDQVRTIWSGTGRFTNLG